MTPCRCSVPMIVHMQLYRTEAHLSQPCQGETANAWVWYRALTLVKQTGLRGSNVLEHGTDYLM